MNAGAKTQIAEIMSQYGLSVADLTGTTKVKSTKERVPVSAKYRNDATGETWTGRGHSRKWLEGEPLLNLTFSRPCGWRLCSAAAIGRFPPHPKQWTWDRWELAPATRPPSPSAKLWHETIQWLQLPQASGEIF